MRLEPRHRTRARRRRPARRGREPVRGARRGGDALRARALRRARGRPRARRRRARGAHRARRASSGRARASTGPCPSSSRATRASRCGEARARSARCWSPSPLRLVAVAGLRPRSSRTWRATSASARHLLDVSWNPYDDRAALPVPAAVGGRRGRGADWLARRGRRLVRGQRQAAGGRGRPRDRGAPRRARPRRGLASPLAPWLYARPPGEPAVGGRARAVRRDPARASCCWRRAARRARPAATPRRSRSAPAIATKSFPVLALPFLAFGGAGSWRAAIALRRARARAGRAPARCRSPSPTPTRCGASSSPTAASPTSAGPASLRGAEWLATGALPRSEARFWPVAALALEGRSSWRPGRRSSLAVRARRLRLPPRRAVLAVLLAFSALYGLQSAQYLLWVVPLALLRPGRAAAAHAAAASVGLVGFYLFLAPGVLHGAARGPGARRGGRALAAGRIGDARRLRRCGSGACCGSPHRTPCAPRGRAYSRGT